MSSRDVWPRRLIEAADRLVWRDPSRARQLARRGVGMLPEKREKAELWLIAGTAASELGEYDDAMECMERAGRLASEAEDQGLRAEAYLRKAGVNYERGRYKAAKELLTRSLRLAMPLGDKLLIGRIFLTAGCVADDEGEASVAKSLYDLVIQVLPPTDARQRASAFSALAGWHEAQGEIRQAREFVRRAAQLVDPREMAAVSKLLWRWGDLSSQLGDWSDARDRYRQALEFQPAHLVDGPLLRLDLAEAYLHLEAPSHAVDLVEQTVALAASAGNEDTRVLTRLAEVTAKLGASSDVLGAAILKTAADQGSKGKGSIPKD